MKKTIKPEDFSDTFTPGLSGDKRKANNDWSVMMYGLNTMGGTCASPDGMYPTLTKTEDGWEYDAFQTVADDAAQYMPRFLIFGNISVDRKINWEGRDALNKTQRKFLHGCTKALREVFAQDPDKFAEGDLTMVMYNNSEDFIASALNGLAVSQEEAKAQYQEMFDK